MVLGDPETDVPQAQSRIRFDQALFVWLKISLLSFGGPAGQIAVMHRLLVDELKWVSERRFLHALNFCMLLPGPEAQQLTIYLGWLLHRVRGGVVTDHPPPAGRRAPMGLVPPQNSQVF